MGQTYYAQPTWGTVEPTMTVGDLIEKLRQHDPRLPVIFKSPLYGAFGSNTAYSIDGAEVVSLEASEQTFPPGITTDEETGETQAYEGRTETKPAWKGVVIT